MVRFRLALLALAIVAGSTAIGVEPAAAAPQVVGGGSTFAKLAIDQWAADARRTLGIDINYQALGSSTGRRQFASGLLDWASSDIPFQPAPIDPVPSRSYTYTPLVAGGTAIAYNLKDAAGIPITDVRLSGHTIAKIFFHEITQWNDPAIVAENPHLAARLPSTDLKPIARASGSGTTAVFTGYLSSAAPASWAKVSADHPTVIRGQPFTSDFPPIPGVSLMSSNDLVATAIAEQTPAANGRIGYCEYGYALQQRLAVARVRNAAGLWTTPTARAVAIALLGASRNPDGTQNLANVYAFGHPETYPISSYNYGIVPTGDISPDKGGDLARFLIYSVTEGQYKAEALGYSPLPPNLIQQALDVMPQIPGSPAPPPVGEYGNIYLSLGIDPNTGEVSAGAGAGGGPGAAAGSGAAASGSAATGGEAVDMGAAASVDPKVGRRSKARRSMAISFSMGASTLEDEDLSARRTVSTVSLVIAGIALVSFILVPPLVGYAGWMPSRRRRRATQPDGVSTPVPSRVAAVPDEPDLDSSA